MPLNIEVKQEEPAIEGGVLAVLDRHGARERTLLAAEHAPIMTRIRAAAPDMLTSCSAAEVAEFVFRLRDGNARGLDAARRRAPGAPELRGHRRSSPPNRSLRRTRLGLEVHVWTINDAAEMDALLDLGVDGIMTDVPALAMAVLRRRGLR